MSILQRASVVTGRCVRLLSGKRKITNGNGRRRLLRISPLYTSEIAQSEIRGALGSYFQLLLTVGIRFAYLVSYITNSKTYRIICSVLPIIFGAVFFLQPETPLYLLKRGKDEEARKSLIKLRGEKYDVDLEIDDIKTLLQEQMNNNVNIWDVLMKPAAKRAPLIAFGLMLFQQLSAVVFYTGDIFKSSGAELDPKIATIIVGIMWL